MTRMTGKKVALTVWALTSMVIIAADVPKAPVLKSAEAEYRLGPEDVIDVFVWKEPELTCTVTVRPEHAYEVSRELIARNIVVDYRENAGIRIAPHFYNSDDEIRLTVGAIAEILADGSWQQHAANRTFVT